MPYTAQAPTRRESNEELKARIPGWGADLDPANRPAVPMERYAPETTGAHWDFPERQPELTPRERSIEHRFVTPVFGTSAPLHGVSGMIRRYAYAQFSEGRAAHWLLLIAGDRVDAIGSHLRSLLTLRPDNPITETGVVAEFTHGGVSSRLGRGRADTKHIWLDPILIAGPWVLGALVALKVGKAVLRRRT